MAITWGSVHLAENPDAESGFYPAQAGFDCSFDGPQFTFQEVVQEDQIVRGTKLSRIARGNAVREATFSVHRTHTNTAEAELFAEDHPGWFTGLASVTWNGGADWENCSVIAVTRSIGQMTITSYRVRGQPS